MATKICTKCKQEKDFSKFNKNKRKKDGLRCTCRECDREYNGKYRNTHREHGIKYAREYYKIHKEERKKYSQVNKDKANGYKKKYLETHKEERKEQANRYYHNHKEQVKERTRTNREKLNFKRRQYNATHPQARIAHNLRSRIGGVLSGKSKGGRLYLLVGCDMDFLKSHLESMFGVGMNWENYGRGIGKWSQDHIIPLEYFDLEDEEQQKIAFNWKNMKPMWYSENSFKGSFYNGKRYNHKNK